MKRETTLIFLILFIGTVVGSENLTANGINKDTPLSLNAIVIDGTISTGEYDYYVSIRTGPVMDLYYTIIKGTIYVGLKMEANGWISMGYGGTGDMSDYDIITGGWDSANNRSYIFDAFSIGKVVPPVDGKQNYNEYAASENGGFTTFEFSRDLKTGDTSVDKELIPGKSMNVIFALHSSSDDISIEHTKATKKKNFIFYGPPAAPENLTATAYRTNVSLSWLTPPGDGGFAISSYIIYRSEDNGTTYTQIATTSQTNYVDTNVVTGTIYYYKVTALNSEGESGDSNVVIALPLGDITPPRLVNTTTASFEANVAWSYPEDDGGIPVLRYNIYRSETMGGPYTFIGTNTTAFGFQDTTVLNGRTYYYVVTALNKYNESSYSLEASASPVGEPTPPLNIEAVNGDNTATLNWTAPITDGGAPITQYNIYRSSTQGGPYTLIGTNDSTTGYYDTGVINGETYYYVVTAVNSYGESTYSDEQRLLIANTPLAPTNLNGTFGDGQVILTWDPADGRGFTVSNYTVYRRDPGASSFVAIATVNATNYTDTGLTNGLTYRYVVTATSQIGESPYSKFFDIAPATVPKAPDSLTVSFRNGKIYLSWNKPTDNGGFPILYYNIYRSIGSPDNYFIYDFSYSKIYIDEDVEIGKTYYYKVTARNKIGESNYSEPASITPTAIPGAPTNLQITFALGVQLTWDEPNSTGGSPIIYYRVYRTTVKDSEFYSIVGTTENTTFTDTNVEIGKTYYYVVTAINNAGESDHSEVKSVKLVTPPAQPTNVVALASEDLVTLAWLASSEFHSPAEYFEVYRAVNDSNEFTKIAETNNTYFIDNDVYVNTTYSYYIVAVNSYGKSEASNVVSVTVGEATTPIPIDADPIGDGFDYPASLNSDVIIGTAAVFTIIGLLGAALWIFKNIVLVK